jgi:hypothetical protein
MAITPRCYSTYLNAAQASRSLTLTGWTNAGLGPTGTAPATGDIVFAVGLVHAASQAFSQTAGTGTWTFQDTGTNNGGTEAATTMCAWRVFTGSETAPTFAWTSPVTGAFSVIALAPDASSAVTTDVWAAIQVDSTGATTHTANPATPPATHYNELSLILAGAIASASGNTAFTVTAPANWTAIAEHDGEGSASVPRLGTVAFYQQSVSGTVTPGAATIEGGSAAAGATQANLYHVLVQEALTTAVSLPGSAAVSGAATRRVGRGLAGTTTAAGTLTRQVAKALPAAAAASGTVSRQVARTLTAAATAQATLTRAAGKTLTAAVTASAAAPGQVGKALAGTVTAAGTLGPRTLGETLAATATVAGTVTRALSRTLTTTAQTAPSVRRGVSRSLTALAAATGSIAAPVTYSRVLTAAAVADAALRRGIGKVLSTAVTAIGSLLPSLLPSAHRAVVTITPAGPGAALVALTGPLNASVAIIPAGPGAATVSVTIP